MAEGMNTQCFLCGSSDYHVIHKGVRNRQDIDVLRCDNCGLVRLSKFVCDEAFYKESGMRKNDAEKSIDDILSSARMDDERRVKYIRSIITNKTLLDFGCGGGGLLRYAKEYAQKVYGVELEENMQRSLQSAGIECFASVDDALKDVSGQVDVVTMFHVLEHLEKPIEVLTKIKKLLAPGGVIIIEIPNADDALLSLYHNASFENFTYWECHLYLYNNTTLRLLIDKVGGNLKFLHQIQRYPISNTLYWLAKGKPGGHIEWSIVSDENLDRAYENQLAKLGIADTIMAIVEI